MLLEVESVDIRVSLNQIVFKLGNNITFYSRLLEGNYPDAARLIPNMYNTKIITNRDILLKSIDRASLLSHLGRSNVIQAKITKNTLVISSNSPEIGEVEEEISDILIEGDELTISFNPDYMKEALKSFEDDKIQIDFKSALEPIVIKPVDDTGDFIQLITPVRTY